MTELGSMRMAFCAGRAVALTAGAVRGVRGCAVGRAAIRDASTATARNATTRRAGGGSSLDNSMTPTIHDDAEIWEKAVRKLRGRLMPPPGGRSPRRSKSMQFVAWHGSALDAGAAGAHAGPRGAAPAESQGVRERRARSARVEIDAATLLPQDDDERRLRQHRRRAAVSPSFIEQYVTAARTDRGSQAVGDAGPRPKPDVQEPDPRRRIRLDDRRRAAASHRRPAARHARRHRREALFPGRRRVPSSTSPTWRQALWVYNMEFENTLIVDARRQQVLRNGHRRRGGHEGHRPGSGPGGRRDQRAPEEHPFHGDRRPAQSRRHVPAPHASRSPRTGCTLQRAGRRPGSRADACDSFEVAGPVQPDRRERDAEPRARSSAAIRGRRAEEAAVRRGDRRDARASRRSVGR